MTLYVDELRSWYQESEDSLREGLLLLKQDYQPSEDSRAFRILSTIKELANEGRGIRFEAGKNLGSLSEFKDSSFWGLFDDQVLGRRDKTIIKFDDVQRFWLEI